MVRYLLGIAVFFVTSGSSYAADSDEKFALQIMNIARSEITTAKLSDGSFVPAETEAEKKELIIPIADARRIINYGMAIGVADWCKVDWKPYYLQFMQNERKNYHWADKQIAYIGILHGVSHELFRQTAQKKGVCSEKQAKHIESKIKN